MVIETSNPNKRVFNGTRVKIFGTNPNNPENGKIYLKTKIGWFERSKSESGDLMLAPISQIEAKLLDFAARGGATTELVPISPEYRKKFYIELLEQLTLSEFEVLFETEWRKSNKLFALIGISLAILGLFMFGVGLYFWLAYSPSKFLASNYTQIFEQAHSAGLTALISSITFEVVGWAIIAVAIFANHVL
jgi:hypothetical protein